MRILLDHQILASQNYGGISRYFVEVADHLKNYPDVHMRSSALFSNNEYLAGSKAIKAIPFLKNTEFRGKVKLIQQLDKAYSTYLIRGGNYDILHPTYYLPYYLKYNKKPVVITCYDLIHEIYMQNDKATLDMKRVSLEKADKIFAISKSTKTDLINHYNIPETKIEVVYLANSLKPADTTLAAHEQKPYLLYVGNRSLYKNFPFFAEAIAPLLQKQKDLFLFCAGGGNFTKGERNLFHELKIENQIEYHAAHDANLSKLYANALAFVYPSLYEGFGIPVLEAMGCGCPVIASNRSSLPEVGGSAAVYFDPGSKDNILGSVETVLGDASLRASLKNKGLAREREFTWEKTAQQSYQLYKSIL